MQLPAAWEKICTLRLLPHPHTSGSEGKKSTKKMTGRKKPSAGPGREESVREWVVEWSFGAFLRDLLPKIKPFLPSPVFFPFSKSNLPAAKDVKFKQSLFSLSVHISRDWQPAANPPGTQSQPSQTHLPANLTPLVMISVGNQPTSVQS